MKPAIATDSRTVQALCDAWRGTITETVREDRRAIREGELIALDAHNAACG